MRRLFVVALFFVMPALSFAETFESRSLHHVMTVEPLGSDQYLVTVTDIVSGKRLVAASLPLRKDTMESSMEDGDLVVRIRLSKFGLGFSAAMTVERGGTVVDAIASQWRPGPPDVLRVGGDVKAPVILTRIEPRYNEEARQARISGIVILEVMIDKTGAVREVTVLKGLPYGLSEAAVEAVRQWMFVPATKNGEAVDVAFNLTVNFRLDGKRRTAE
jgi:TonB family protein